MQAEEPPVDKELRTLPTEGHVAEIFCATFSPDGKWLASGGREGEIVLWETNTWRERLMIAGDQDGTKGHFEDVWGLAFSPDGKRLASASHDKTVRLWDVTTGKQLQVLTGHSFHVWGVAFSPDGKLLASAGGIDNGKGQFGAGEVKMWEAATGKALLSLKVQGSRVDSVAFSPDGNRLATAWEDKAIRVWDTTTGKELFALKGHADEVKVVAWSPDGKRLASGSRDSTVRVWDIADRKEVQTLRGYDDVTFSADGTLLATGGSEGIRVWDATGSKEIRACKDRGSNLVFSPNGKQLVWPAGIRQIKVWMIAN